MVGYGVYAADVIILLFTITFFSIFITSLLKNIWFAIKVFMITYKYLIIKTKVALITYIDFSFTYKVLMISIKEDEINYKNF